MKTILSSEAAAPSGTRILPEMQQKNVWKKVRHNYKYKVLLSNFNNFKF